MAFHGTTLPTCLGFRDGLVYRRVLSYGLQNMQQFSVFSDAEIDEIAVEYLNRHGLRTYLAGYLKPLGLRAKKKDSQKFH